jgi:precorrin-2 dehydrogenase/sirohydrochlorin ferrochelatase
MKYYPICLRVAGRSCLVIGGGRVAEQKAWSLLKAGAHVTIISPEITPDLEALVAAHQLQYERRPYASTDLKGVFLAYAATNDETLHAQIAQDAVHTGTLLNVVDRPRLCDFIVPAVMERGDLLIATSTSGASPGLAQRIRDQIEQSFGPEYDLAVQLLGRLRARLASQSLSSTERRRIFATLVDSPLLDHLRECRTIEIDRLLAATVGDGVSLASLGMELP